MCKLPHLLQRRKKMGQRTITVVAEEKRGGPLNTGIPEKHAVVRNTVLLSAGMAALYGMNQLTVAVATTTFALVSDRDG
jgi:hypothetical protein